MCLSSVSISNALFVSVSFRRWQSVALDTTIGGFSFFRDKDMGYKTFKFKLYDNKRRNAFLLCLLIAQPTLKCS